jgi:membrane-associated phospholipid phosphatase
MLLPVFGYPCSARQALFYFQKIIFSIFSQRQTLYLAGMNKSYPRIFGTVIFLVVVQLAQAQNSGIHLLKKINATETGFKNWYLGGAASSVIITSIGVPLTVYVAGLIQHNKQLQRDGLYMAGSYVLSAVLTQGIKRTVNRKRPFETYSFIVNRDNEDGGLSFPSGHTSAAFCTATELALRWHKWYVIVPAYLYAGSVGWARMYQGVHYPGDVLAGALLGAGSAWLGWKFQQWRYSKRNKSSNTAIPGTPRF